MSEEMLTFNFTNNTLYNKHFEVFIRTFDLVICFISFFLNTLVARTLIITRSREAPITTIFIAILLADAFNSVMGFVMCMSYFCRGRDITYKKFEQNFCNIYGVITWGNCGATILLAVTLSILRLVAIKSPFKFRTELHQRRLLLMVGACYFLGYVEGLKPFIMDFQYSHQTKYYKCSIYLSNSTKIVDKAGKTALIISLVLPLFVPTLVFILTSVGALIRLYLPILRRQPSDVTRRTAARVTIAMVTCFLCCYTPWMVAHCMWFVIFSTDMKARSRVNNLMNIGQLLEMTGVYINAFLNPLIILVSNTSARRRLTKRCRRDLVCCPSISCSVTQNETSQDNTDNRDYNDTVQQEQTPLREE